MLDLDNIITQIDDWKHFKVFVGLPTNLMMRPKGLLVARQPITEKEGEEICVHIRGKEQIQSREADWASVRNT